MAHLDSLIERIPDEDLRADIAAQVENLMKTRSWGLVFQEHRPETVELPHAKIRIRSLVRVRTEIDGGEWVVTRIRRGGVAELRHTKDANNVTEAPVKELVAVWDFSQQIYPGLKSLGRIETGGDKPFHAVINGENYHALKTLLYAYEEKFDAIYIDPPYNSGSKDWKYNNDYVDGVDLYRHSKWLAFMERRLKLAIQLLNPDNSVLIVTIDENEVHHLGMLLERMFPTNIIQMVTIVINPLGQARKQELARVEEYAFFVQIGSAQPTRHTDDFLSDELKTESSRPEKVRWERLIRGGNDARRAKSPQLFFPVFINPQKKSIVRVGDPLPANADRESVEIPEGQIAVWPLREDGTEGRWRCSPSYLRELLSAGYAKVGTYDAKNDKWSILYLGKAQIRRIDDGHIEVTGRDPNGTVIVESRVTNKSLPKTVWNRLSHRAGEHGSGLIKKLIPGRAFPYPKSVYAVADALRIATGDKPDARILDFFAGSGTTAHAVALLNAEDGGSRQSVLVTNNEVSVEEAENLRAAGHRHGDEEWEAMGIFHHVTRPRIEAAITGVTHRGDPIVGDYLDGQPMAEGFQENVEFFDLSYEDADRVALRLEFEAIAPLLWLKAGAKGPCIDRENESWEIPENGTYGILFNPECWSDFTDAVRLRPAIKHAFIVTNSDAVFEQISDGLPSGVEPHKLYEDYLRNFRISEGASS
ncbi:DNA methyltransferase (plasmid) [Paenarthrobacter sp. R1]|uniref:site-specific DNA-methyltransferase n=1 Tax=Paenarthrobacter sp. R1 TaxID=3049085 RepID=UPI00084E802D|nr:DNA methyltransferase [Paenarthrobacter sp. R1]NKR12640.1 hypothetical protein [Arthrobacter sp. M5]NKR16515.1 hypothetical protein [Arthrobacter sp. M6]OEH60110.1 hypothetical protein A5N17_17410 [Arthrobacter sp. D2]OEH63746.1 hypothetical protein A5N13_14055 [Arthrobacter sp. D4]WIV33646.1 DNA methyltransferase [Paenarthrobacter sp. R1]